MYKKIVIGYGDGTMAREVLRQGAELAVSARSCIVLVTAVPADRGITVMEAARPSTPSAGGYEHALEVAESGARTLRARGLKVRPYVGTGEPANVLAQIARDEGADLIVVGERRRNPLARWWSPDTAAALVPRAPCSVLVARPVESVNAAIFAA